MRGPRVTDDPLQDHDLGAYPTVPDAGQELPSRSVHRPDTNRQPRCALRSDDTEANEGEASDLPTVGGSWTSRQELVGVGGSKGYRDSLLLPGDFPRGSEIAEPLTSDPEPDWLPSGLLRHGMARVGFRPRPARGSPSTRER